MSRLTALDFVTMNGKSIQPCSTGSFANMHRLSKAARLAGAVTYAAAVAKGLRQSACVVTLAGTNYDLQFLGDHHVHAIPSESTLTFEHSYTWFGNQRRLRVAAEPNQALASEHIPWRCRLARTILVGPLTQSDVDVASFTKPASWLARLLLNFQYVGVMAQGYQRKLGKANRVEHMKQPSQMLEDSVTSAVNLFLSDVETDPWSASEFERIVHEVQSLIVTRGAKGKIFSSCMVKRQTFNCSRAHVSPSLQ